MRNILLAIALIIVSIFLLTFVYPEISGNFFDPPSFLKKDFILGLDLIGGAHLVYEADFSGITGLDRAESMEGVRDVIERRINFFGISEPLVQISGENRLIVELAGITNINEAINLIGETPFLEFKEQREDLTEVEDGDSSQILSADDLFVSTGLDGKHLERATVIFDPQTGVPEVSLILNEEGKELFAEITKRNLNKIVAIYLDGEVISAPVVNSEITTGQALITGGFTPSEARLLATRLNAGALPVPITLVSQQTIGASLGAESLSKSLRAGIYGLLLVAVFMVLFYRLPGLLAVLALIFYTLIVLSLYKLLPVTLTLSGIAGFILSLGIAVDANILIFARMREEMSAGKTIRQSIGEGFSRAWFSIRDSHVTTLIGAGVLYIFTTSFVRGFALTLSLGILVSFFTSIVVTKLLLDVVSVRWVENHRRLFK